MNKITETAAPPWIARVEQFDITGVMMDVFVIVLAAFAALGFLDKAIGGRFGFDREIDSGLSTMGTMSVYIVGIYCVGTVLIEGNSETIGNATSFLPMDPSILSGGILAPDLGGQPIAMGLAEDRDMGFFRGWSSVVVWDNSLAFNFPSSLPFSIWRPNRRWSEDLSMES